MCVGEGERTQGRPGRGVVPTEEEMQTLSVSLHDTSASTLNSGGAAPATATFVSPAGGE